MIWSCCVPVQIEKSVGVTWTQLTCERRYRTPILREIKEDQIVTVEPTFAICKNFLLETDYAKILVVTPGRIEL